MASNTTFVAGNVLTAAEMNNLPWGIVTATAGGTSGSGYVRNTTTAVTINAAIDDVSGMTISWTAISTRIYKITVTLADVNTVSGMAPFLIDVADGSNVTKFQTRRAFPANDTDTITFSYVETGLTGTILRKVRVQGTSNPGTFNTNAAAALSVFVIEDIGAT
jgi:hypothetical protein